MRLMVNGEPKEMEEGVTVALLFTSLEIDPTYRAVAVNAQVVPRKNYSITVLKEGDRVEIIQAVGGGTGEDP
ncbi:MAG TPA: sulfur carrier protein ThiS [bacterium]|nr:MAG: thiamine biosynthesis protein ThiS [Acidobacteria bacterium RIFCSPLOWO2_02_FULL_59_13]HLC27152.1 sulfur carrier protein ThiS [bacterium]